MTGFACGHCGGRHASMGEVRECATKNPGTFSEKPPWEQWRKKHSARRPRPELNVERCPTCRAEGGKACISKRTGKVLFLTHTTHKRLAIAKKQEEARLNNPDFRPMALDETYGRLGGSTSAGSQDSLAE